MELLTRWDQFFPSFKSVLLFFFKGGRELQQINRTINFLIYLLQRSEKKKSMQSDRNTRTDRRKTFYMQVSIWNRTTSSGLSGDRHLQFPDCIIEMGFLLPLKKKKSMLHSVDIKFSAICVLQTPPLKNRLLSSLLLTVFTAFSRAEVSVANMMKARRHLHRSLGD